VDKIVGELRQRPPVLIDATEIVKDFKSQPSHGDVALDVTPGFEHMWIEYQDINPDGTPSRQAIGVFRLTVEECRTIPNARISMPETARHCLFCSFWCDGKKGIPVLYGGARFMLDSLGEIVSNDFPVVWNSEDMGNYDVRVAVALETLTTMNTRGTRIEPPLDAKTVQIVKPNRAPCSVWHTIHLPKMASIPLGAETSETILERREHWVRAHRRDYRHGAGMFGRVKALVWVPEFQRGNPELGSVKQTYKVAAR
jgi:hypothetical protein